MPNSSPQPTDQVFLHRALEAFIRIGFLVLLAAWCFQIVRPFITPVVWGIIIAVASDAMYRRLLAALRQRHVLAATVFVLLCFIVLITPIVMLSGTVINSAHGLASYLREGAITIPPPPASVETWPIIGQPLAAFWTEASQDLKAALNTIAPQLKAIAGWLLTTAAGAGFGILQFIVAIIIAGGFLAKAQRGHRVATALATRLAGERGPDFVMLAGATVRSVATGIVGVALIQAILAGLGFLVAGVPAAGFWALLCLIFGILQIGVVIILIPMVIYVFSTADTGTAVVFLIYNIPVGLVDNILRPILLGRGVEVPMLVIFVGAIGGFLASGIVGLFVGPIVLAMGYELFMAWIDEIPQPVSEPDPDA